MKHQINNVLSTMTRLIVCVTLGLPLAGCLQDDAGEVAFVRQAVPAVLGRRVRNVAEFELLVELAQSVDREAVVDLLMEQPEFVDYWESVLFEKLRGLERKGSPGVMSACVDSPVFGSEPGDHDGRVAEHIMNTSVAVQYDTSFNLRDVLRSSIVADDLRPAVLTNLLTMASANDDATDASTRFMEVYLNRDGACLECHNSTFSKTDEDSGWTRHYPLPWDLDGDVWSRTVDACPDTSYAVGTTYDSANGELLYDAHNCGDCHGSGSSFDHAALVPDRVDAQIIDAIREGSSTMTAYDDGMLSPDELSDLLAYMRDEFGEYAGAGCPDWQSTDTYFDSLFACRPGQLCAISFELSETSPVICHSPPCAELPDVPLFEPVPTPPPWGMLESCGLHKNNEDGTQTSTIAGQTDHSALGLVEALKFGMIDLVVNDAAADLLVSPPVGPASALDSMGTPIMGFAYAVAASLTNSIGEELTGKSMRLEHGFSRNESQRETLFAGTHELLGGPDGGDGRWSLKRVVRAWLTSPAFNLKMPDESSEAEPYTLLALFDPWFDPDPRAPLNETADASTGVGYNGVGDVVHRPSFNNLLLQLHHALGWPKPELLSRDNDPYLNSDLRRALGQPLSADIRGFEDVTFQSLLAWESAFGQCENPNGSEGDWIRELARSASPVNTLKDLAQAVKWRLLQDTIDDPLEQGAIARLFPGLLPAGEQEGPGGVTPPGGGSVPGGGLDIPPLDLPDGLALLTPLAALDPVDVETGIRRFCGVLLTSPQFMLSMDGGSSDTVPEPPVVEVCFGTEACTEQDVYDAYAPGLTAIGLGYWVPTGL